MTRHFIITCFLVLSCAAQSATPAKLRVGIVGFLPFVTPANQAPAGISVELFEHIAKQLQLNYQFERLSDINTGLARLKAGTLNMLVGPIAITAEQMRVVDFSQPYYHTGLGVAVQENPPSDWDDFKPLVKLLASGLLGFMVLGSIVVGILIWLFEREGNPKQFSGRFGHGLINGAWFALETITTVGYGDIVPKSIGGRIVTGFWMVLALVWMAAVTATISATFTISHLPSKEMQNISGLRNKRVAFVAGFGREAMVAPYGMRPIEMPDLRSAFTALQAHHVDAVVHDRPQLKYYVFNKPETAAVVTDISLAHETYGFAFAANQQRLIHDVNLQILMAIESDTMHAIEAKWVGAF